MIEIWVFARTSLWYFPTILDDDDDDDEEEDDEVEDNDKDDDNNNKDISALGLDRDMGFSRGHQGRQGHRPQDDDDDDEDCLLYTSPSPRDRSLSRMPSSA